MTLKEILECSGSWSAIAVLAFCTLLQIAPIKINPWSWLAKKIGKAINGEVIVKVDEIKEDVQQLRAETKTRDTDLCRTRILRFGDELIHEKSRYHTKEHFDQIMDDIDTYEKYCRAHPEYKNTKAVSTIQLIEKTYQHCMDEGSFL